LWELSEKVSARLKANELAGTTVTLKLKSADFRLRTRARSLNAPTQLVAKIFAAGRELLAREAGGTKFRLIGIGVSALGVAAEADPADLVDEHGRRSVRRARGRPPAKVRPRRRDPRHRVRGGWRLGVTSENGMAARQFQPSRKEPTDLTDPTSRPRR
jgi:hypothetical protein